MRVPSHLNGHGLPLNRYACGAGQHRGCTGFAGPHDRHLCGCCCHCARFDTGLTDQDQAVIAAVLRRS